jgi:hypothetical protein
MADAAEGLIFGEVGAARGHLSRQQARETGKLGGWKLDGEGRS